MKKLSYYILDFDDNILNMNTKIIMEKNINGRWIEIAVSTTDFTLCRKDPKYRIPLKEDYTPDYEKAYSNFRDNNNPNIFLEDVKDAIIDKKFAPSYDAFKKCLINGHLLIIITARGHENITIKKGIEYIIETQLTSFDKEEMIKNLKYYHDLFDEIIEEDKLIDNYLNKCYFIGVTSDYFKNLVVSENLYSEDIQNLNTEDAKKIAVSYIVKKLSEYKKSDHIMKIGFSDDDKANVNNIIDLFKNSLKTEHPNIEFSVFDTSKNIDGSLNYIETVI